MLTLTTLIMFAIGLLVLFILCKVFAWPLKILWKLVINAVIGALVLLVINFVGGIFGFTLPITTLSALIVGVLGVPGVILLAIWHFIL